MKVKDILDMLDETKSNKYPDKLKISWLNEIEEEIIAEVYCRSEELKDYVFEPYAPDDYERDLLAPDRFADVYLYFLASKVDALRGEAERYNNDSVLFNEAWDRYSCHMNQHHVPVRLPNIEKW